MNNRTCIPEIDQDKTQLVVTAEVMHTQSRKTFTMKVLIDSGCAQSCVNIALIRKQGWPTDKLPRLIKILYADGGKNPKAMATTFCEVIAKVNRLEMLI